jgi:hypothetical protein
MVKSPLGRLFRLRSLLEDVSRLELEMRLQELAQVEAGLDHLAENRKQSRDRSFEGFARAENAVWTEAEALGELTAWQQNVLGGLHEKRTTAVSAAKVEFLERRKESRQVENVLKDRSAEKAIAHTRREQRVLDDWFNQRNQ